MLLISKCKSEHFPAKYSLVFIKTKSTAAIVSGKGFPARNLGHNSDPFRILIGSCNKILYRILDYILLNILQVQDPTGFCQTLYNTGTWTTCIPLGYCTESWTIPVRSSTGSWIISYLESSRISYKLQCSSCPVRFSAIFLASQLICQRSYRNLVRL